MIFEKKSSFSNKRRHACYLLFYSIKEYSQSKLINHQRIERSKKIYCKLFEIYSSVI